MHKKAIILFSYFFIEVVLSGSFDDSLKNLFHASMVWKGPEHAFEGMHRSIMLLLGRPIH